MVVSIEKPLRQVVLRLLSDLHTQAEEGISAHTCTCMYTHACKTGSENRGEGKLRWKKRDRREGVERSKEGRGRGRKQTFIKLCDKNPLF